MKIQVGDTIYDHEPNRLLNSDAILVKRRTGMTIPEWQQGLQDDDPEAIKALVFLLKQKAGENPDWDTLDFDHGDLDYLSDGPVEQPAPKEDAPEV